MKFVRAADLLAKCGGDKALREALGVLGRRPSDVVPRRGTAPSVKRVKRVGQYKGWRQAGPGRRRGGGFYAREELVDVFVVMLCTALHRNLLAHYDQSVLLTRALRGLRKLRERYLNVTDRALRTRA